MINEAALLRRPQGLKAITNGELEEARDKVRWGTERRSMAMSEKEKESTAWHEAGHALVNVLLEHTDPLHKVTIIPARTGPGLTMYLPRATNTPSARSEALDLLAVIMRPGASPKSLFTDDVSNGAAGDIKQMTRLARKMVCEWGMSEKIGMVEYGEHEDYVFLGRDFSVPGRIAKRLRRRSTAKSQSSSTTLMAAPLIFDQEPRKVEAIAKALLEYETLDGIQVREIMDHGHMLNPSSATRLHAAARWNPRLCRRLILRREYPGRASFSNRLRKRPGLARREDLTTASKPGIAPIQHFACHRAFILLTVNRSVINLSALKIYENL